MSDHHCSFIVIAIGEGSGKLSGQGTRLGFLRVARTAIGSPSEDFDSAGAAAILPSMAISLEPFAKHH